MNPKSLRQTIDRMVEDAIRRVLPSVMNEVLLKTLTSSGALQPLREVRTAPKGKPAPKARKPLPVKQSQARPKQKPPQRNSALAQLLETRGEAGAEFFQDPRGRDYEVDTSDLDEPYAPPPAPNMNERMSAIAPHLRSLAEGMVPDVGESEEWGDGEFSSAPAPIAPGEVRDIGRAAEAVGMDFSRMKGLIGKTSPVKRVDHSAAEANAKFNEGRIARMRQSLETKPGG